LLSEFRLGGEHRKRNRKDEYRQPEHLESHRLPFSGSETKEHNTPRFRESLWMSKDVGRLYAVRAVAGRSLATFKAESVGRITGSPWKPQPVTPRKSLRSLCWK
jgi:hypothetical protein